MPPAWTSTRAWDSRARSGVLGKPTAHLMLRLQDRAGAWRRSPRAHFRAQERSRRAQVPTAVQLHRDNAGKRVRRGLGPRREKGRRRFSRIVRLPRREACTVCSSSRGRGGARAEIGTFGHLRRQPSTDGHGGEGTPAKWTASNALGAIGPTSSSAYDHRRACVGMANNRAAQADGRQHRELMGSQRTLDKDNLLNPEICE